MFTPIETPPKHGPQVSWEQRLLRNAGRQRTSLKPEYQELKFTLHRKLVDKINLEALATIDNQRVRSEVRQAVIQLIDAEPTLLSSLEKQQISDEVLDEVFGLGPLEPLLTDPTISNILVNTYKQVYVERRGLLELTNVTFRDDQHLLRIIDKIVSQVGRRIDESTPMVDARLSDGSRVNAIIGPLAVDGPILSIRRFSTDKLMPPDLVERMAMTQGMMELLEAAVKARLNIIIAGGSGSGKTTLLNALSAFINGKERIVTIEDAAELQLKQPHVVRLETRPANLEGNGAVRQRELLVNSLRMRPDRIVVGEVRGEEALDMLQAMNTGHDGSLTTVHANAPRDAVSRLEVMVSLANSNMQLVSIRQQIASAVHLLVQAARLSDGSRRVVSITEVTGMEELENDRKEAEERLAMEQLARMGDRLKSLAERQARLVGDTESYENMRRQSNGKLTIAQRAGIRGLGQVQGGLKDETGGLIEQLEGAPVFSLTLKRAMESMEKAAGRLQAMKTDDETQQAVRSASHRFEQLIDALKEDDAKQGGQGGGGGGGGGAGGGDGIPATAQLKMLKTLQQEINERTESFDELRRRNQKLTPEQTGDAERLANDQGALADLVRDLTKPKRDDGEE